MECAHDPRNGLCSCQQIVRSVIIACLLPACGVRGAAMMNLEVAPGHVAQPYMRYQGDLPPDMTRRKL